MEGNFAGTSRRARSRRAQYANQACNNCKRRKVKCDGSSPCERCVSMEIPCSYDNSESSHPHKNPRTKIGTRPINNVSDETFGSGEPSTNQGIRVEENIGETFRIDQSTNIIDSTTGPATFIGSSSSQITSRSPEFCGPSSSEYTLNVVSGNLKALGFPSAILGKSTSTTREEDHAISPLTHYGPLAKLLTMDPLWEWSQDEAIDLVNNWFDGVGSLYPVVCRTQMLDAARTIFQGLDHARHNRSNFKVAPVAEALFNKETNKLKAVLAIGRTLQSGGRNDQAQRLFQSISEAVEALIWNAGGIDGIQLLILVAIYHYHLDDEMRSGRIIGFAARSCLEVGLHRQEMVEKLFPAKETQIAALKTFWSAYMFERRTSLGQGIPFCIHDSFIDSSILAQSTFDPVVTAMIGWAKLAGKAWQALNIKDEKGGVIDLEHLNYLDYQINMWYQQLPNNLKFDRSQISEHQGDQRDMYYKAVFSIRKGHLRNLIHRPVLQTSRRISENESFALQAGNIAKESIRVISDLHDHTLLITTHPLFFTHLLLTAFGNLLLAVVNSPQTFWNQVREEFDKALNLIKLLSARSMPLLRLWRRLEGLQKLQSQILPSNSPDHETNPAEVSTGEDNPTLRFEDLFPSLPLDTMHQDDSFSPGLGIGSTEMVEQVNGLFGTFAGSNFVFDLFENWGPPG